MNTNKNTDQDKKKMDAKPFVDLKKLEQSKKNKAKALVPGNVVNKNCTSSNPKDENNNS